MKKIFSCVRSGAVLVLLAADAVPLPAQTTNAPTQVGPGTTGSISSQGVKKSTPDKQHAMLNSALSPETRKKLQEAMESSNSQ